MAVACDKLVTECKANVDKARVELAAAELAVAASNVVEKTTKILEALGSPAGLSEGQPRAVESAGQGEGNGDGTGRSGKGP